MSRGDFWSRRKAKVQAEQEAEARAALAAEEAAREEELAEKPDAEILEELGLPDPDTLEPGADFRAFMQKAVPDRIRRRALRRLWLSNPALANLDGLIDYGEDFTDSATVLENLQTAYQVGKGMMAHVEELARQAEEKSAAESDAANMADATDAAEEPADSVVQTCTDTAQADTDQDDDPDQHGEAYVWQDNDPEPSAPPRRRLRFSFDDRAPPGQGFDMTGASQ
ncbi:hypothetical protein RAZWK3B_06952 [Roseobacter sp. AzwK-3b]|uniref:DUF3306 domain-containing protein n=1 Tax=Roseobacter sp. AzwK-3b TaxID=351016 RepID=UPI000156A95C|nr:DUF3306 domain-containing protein [Roseobacter sp. AzwK-3b]EDM70409.1 hypothetical protein RAZWK3B_06952 [Roseobacter sp. AzwK-3b]